jgi:hypothetical protein
MGNTRLLVRQYKLPVYILVSASGHSLPRPLQKQHNRDTQHSATQHLSPVASRPS